MRAVSRYNLEILARTIPARTIALLFAASGILCAAEISTPVSTPRFNDYPFDQWAAAPEHPAIKWELHLLSPQLSVHQRLIERVQAVIPGAELEKRRGRGELVLLVRLEDSDGQQWRAGSRLDLARVQQGVKSRELTFSIAAFVGVAHAVISSRRAARPAAPDQTVAPLERTAVRTRAGWLMVEMAAVDWIETQGNYLALHVGAQTHLIRETARRFEPRLDPGRFIRIHRRSIVAVDRIRELRPLDAGDAIVRLDTDAELRVSRGYRERLQARLRGDPAAS